jgi:predicted outer membrane lipoprotein
VSVQVGVTVLIVGLLLAALLAVVVSRWALKMDRRARRKQQNAVRKRRRVGGVDGR